MLEILKEFEQIYCLEIPNGIRTNIVFTNNEIELFPDERFEPLFDLNRLKDYLVSFGLDKICISGVISGPCLTFKVFDVILNKGPIALPLAKEVARFLKFEFVPFEVTTAKEAEFKTGVILKPIQECVDEDGNRIILEIK